MSTDQEAEWRLVCRCGGPDHRAWENNVPNETTARAHLAFLRDRGHPVRLERRTITRSDWEDIT